MIFHPCGFSQTSRQVYHVFFPAAGQEKELLQDDRIHAG
jgi:hypothetical protein